MGDPIKELHKQMAQKGYLNQENEIFENFVAKLESPEERQRLFEGLQKMGEIGEGTAIKNFDQFNTAFFSGYEQTVESLKKKEVDGSPASSDAGQAPAPTAGTNTDAQNPLTGAHSGYHPLNKDQIQSPEEDFVGLDISKEDLIAKRQDKRDQKTGTAPLVAAESTGVNTPLKSMPDMDINPDADPIEAGTMMFGLKEDSFEKKEERASRSPIRKVERDVSKIEAYTDKADRQTRFADFHMREKYGADWQDQFARLSTETSEEYLSRNRDDIDPEELIQKQAQLNRMKEDPMLRKFVDGVEAQAKSFRSYKAAVNTPAYARHIARKKRAQSSADDSAMYKGLSFLGQVTGPVVAGIANLPRTVLDATGVGAVPVVDDLADWADKQTLDIEGGMSLGSTNDQALWSDIAQFKGMQVQIDNGGNPIRAIKDGKEVEMTTEDVNEFIESGAANTARTTFNGWENAGFSTAKTLANLYLMRSLGGGTSLGTGATSFVITYKDLYDEAMRDLNYSAAEAAQYAIANAGVQAAAEATFGKLDVTPLTLKRARAFGTQEAKALTGQMSAWETGKAAGKAVMKEVVGENIEELTQMATDHLATAQFNAYSGGSIEREAGAQEIAETILMTTAVSLIASGGDAKRIGQRSQYNRALVAAVENPDAALQTISQIYGGDEQAKARLDHLVKVNQGLPKGMSIQDRADVLALEMRDYALTADKEEPKEVKDAAKAEKAKVRAQINNIVTPPEVETTAEGETKQPDVEPVEQIDDGPKKVETEEEQQVPVESGPEATIVPADEEIVEDIILEQDQPAATDIAEDVIMQQDQTVAEDQVVAEEEPITDYSSALSDEYKGKVSDSDIQNLNDWVNMNLEDEELMAQYPDRNAAIRDLVSDFEGAMLDPKYAGGDMELKIETDQIINAIPDENYATIAETLGAYMDANGDIDVDQVRSDLDDGKIDLPQEIKDVVYGVQTQQTGQPVQDQRTQSGDGSAKVSTNKDKAKPRKRTGSKRPYATEAGTPEVAPSESQIEQQINEADLPPLGRLELSDMHEDGIIDEQTFKDAMQHIGGKQTDVTQAAFDKATKAMNGLKKPVTRKNKFSRSGVNIDQRSDGVLEVSGDNVRDVPLNNIEGANWNATLGRWEVPAGKGTDALNEIIETLEGEQVHVTNNKDLTDQVNSPGAKTNERKRKKRFKAASSFEERLRIAETEHGLRPEAGDPKAVQKVLGKLKAAFPGVKVHTGMASFTEKMTKMAEDRGITVEERDGIPGYLFDDGRWEAPTAFEVDGEIFINPRLAHVDTVVHEFGHLWNSWLKANNPAEHDRGLALAKESEYMDAVKDHPLYKDLTEDEQAEEALAYAIGDAGRRISESGRWLAFKNWLGDMWRSVGRALKRNGVERLTVQQFADEQAKILLSGNVATGQSGREIVANEQQQAILHTAQSLEEAGYPTEQIFAITGAKRGDDGQWRIPGVQARAKFDAGSELDQNNTFKNLIEAPAITQAFPDWDVPVRLESQVLTPYFKDGTLVMSPVATQAYIDSAVQAAQTALPFNKKVVTRSARHATTLGNGPVPGSTSQHARMQSARQIIQIELQNNGMKDYEANAKALAKSLGLRHQDVLAIYESEADAARYGRVVLDLGTAKSRGEGKVAQLMESVEQRKNAWEDTLRIFFRRYFTVKGLFPEGIYKLADKRAKDVAAIVTEARYIMKDLEKAMKKEYGNVTDAHWRLVDNVLRGEGDWYVLPDGVRAAAIEMRNFTDMLSQRLVTSGATNSKMVLTILNNSGVAATEANLRNWQGVNIQEALDTLPYMRTQQQKQAIEQFLKQNNRMLGTYFYRSYRKHKDDKWKFRVPPRVIADARAFLISQIESRVADIEAARDVHVDRMQDEIDAREAKIQNEVDRIQNEITSTQQRLVDLAKRQQLYVHSKGVPNKSLQKQRDAAKKRLDAWQLAQKDVALISGPDIAMIMDLTEADISALAVSARKIVRQKQKIQELQDTQDAALAYRSGEYENLKRILRTPPGDYGGIDGLINNILHNDKEEGDFPGGKIGSKKLGFLTKRQDIPREIRDLMGEFHDARVNFAESTIRMAGVLADQNFLLNLRERFEGIYFFPPEMEDMGVEMASRGSESMDPLNGWRTTPEIKQALNDFYSPREQMSPIINSVRWLSDWVKFGKTILSPITHFRNFFSNLYFVAQNGFIPKDLRKAAQAFANGWGTISDSQQRAYVTRLAELGIIGSGAASGDIRAVIERTRKDAVNDILAPNNRFDKILKFSQETYGAEDDFFRIMTFEAEKRRYSKAYFKKKFDELSPEQQAEVEKLAADLVAETMPTYSKVPRFGAVLREVPLFGTFIAFPAEMFRVTANQIKRVYTELQDPRTRSIAISRMLGMAAAQVGPMIAVALSRHIIGVGDDEEKAARYFVPPWLADSMWVWDKYEPGKLLSFRNLGYSDPYAFYKRPIIGMFSGTKRDAMDRLGSAAYSLLAPFLDVELTTGSILSLAYNRDPNTGDEIYNPGAGILEDWRNSGKFALRQLQPGAVKFGYDISSVFTGEGQFGTPAKEWDDIALNLIGYATSKTDLDRAVAGRGFEVKRMIEYSRQLWYDNRYKYKDDPEGLQGLYERTTDMYNEAIIELSLLMENAIKVGMSPADVITSMREKVKLTEDEINAARAQVKLYPKFKGFNK